MPVIRVLPPNLINQIAAGEVIERPASVVKELLENSIDAGSTRVEVTIEGGGIDLIRIADNGCGMTSSQLPLAATQHATSKLPTDDALFHVGTLGFRGEAIASIGSVSHMKIRSRPNPEASPSRQGIPPSSEADDAVDAENAADDSGHEMEIRGGVLKDPVPCGCPRGTVIEVRNLFFNTPVRRRFLKKPQTEHGHTLEAFTRLALANPHVHMVFQNNQKVVHDLPPTTNWGTRIAAFFGPEIAQALIPIQSDDGQVRISGYVCNPTVSRGNTRLQYLFLNGRCIRDRSLQHALGQAYRGLLMTNRHPVCFLRLEMPPEWIDVNVHPTKMEVRFTDSGQIYGRLLQTLRHKFLTSDLTAVVGGSNGEAPLPPTDDQRQDPAATSLSTHLPSDSGSTLESKQRQSVIEWARGEDSAPPANLSQPFPEFQPFSSTTGDSTGSLGNLPSTASRPDVSRLPQQPVAKQHFDGQRYREVDHATADTAHGLPAWQRPGSKENQSPPGSLDSSSNQYDDHSIPIPTVSYLGFQVHNRYLVTQDQDGMVVVDQHALHERVLYERLKERIYDDSKPFDRQPLLVPEEVTVTAEEHAIAFDAKEALDRIGLEVEAPSSDQLLVRSMPTLLHGKLSPGEALRQVLDALMSNAKDPEIQDLVDHLLHTMACKAAVKAGDPLTPEEITSLLEQRDLYHDTHHCPHGRPTALFFSRDELDRMFGRLGPRKLNS